VIAAIALIPVLVTPLPPLADLPNHLARFFIMNNLAADADLQKYYAVQWQLMSFQSSDLIMPPLAQLFGLENAARLYILATFAALIGGVLALHRALFGRIGLWPAAAFLLLYNFMFAWGLLSFLFAAGFALALFAGWIASAGHSGIVRNCAFALGALVVFICHFFAFAIYGVLVLTFELGRRNEARLGRRLAGAVATLILPSVLFLLAPHSHLPAVNFYGDLDDKIRAILSPVTMYLTTPDFVLAIAVILLAALARQRHLFVFAAAAHWPFAAILFCTVLMPSQLLSVWGADFRLPTITLLLLIGATDLAFRTRRQAALCAGLFAALMLVRIGFVTADWHRMAADIDEFRAATAVIDRGSAVVAVQSIEDRRLPPAASLFPYRHIAGYAVIDRGVFLPHLFAAATPLRFVGLGRELSSDTLAVLRKPEWQPADPAFAAAGAETRLQVAAVQDKVQQFELASSTIDWSHWPEHFQYLIDFDYGHPGNPVPALLTEVHRGSYFTIFRIHPPLP